MNNYLNADAFTSPAAGTYSTLKPNAFVGPSRFQNDLALTRTSARRSGTLQFRWEVFNVLNQANFNNPTSGLNSSNFGRILSGGRSADHAVRVQVRLLSRKMKTLAAAAIPSTCMRRDGKQYVVMAAGGGVLQGPAADTLIGFSFQ